MTQRVAVDWLKLAVVLSVNVSATVIAVVALLTDSAEVGAMLPILSGLWGTTVGYLYGNGRLVAKGQPPQPILRASDEDT